MKRVRNIITISLLALTVLFGGIGCKEGVTPQQRSLVQPVTITYWTVFNDVEELRKLAAQYKQIRPYVTVNVRQVRVEEFDKLFVNALADDVHPDVVSIHSRWLKKYQSRLSPAPASVQVAQIFQKDGIKKETIIQPLQVAIPNARFVNQQYITTVGEDVVLGGEVYGLPMSLDTMALYYNKDLLDASGIPLPPASWAELLDMVKLATTYGPDGNIVQSAIPLGTGSNIDNAADIFALLLEQNGVKLTDGTSVDFARNLKDNIENHPTRETLRFLTDFSRRTKEAYTWDTYLGNALDAFVSGRSVFYIGYAYDLERIKSGAPQMNLEVVPLPQLNPEKPVNVANYWVESVVKKSEHQNIAWDFVRFITDENQVLAYTKAARRPTPFRSQIEGQLEDPLLEPFAKGLLTANNWYKGRDAETAKQIILNLIDLYREPYGDEETPEERDAKLIGNAASLLQQTM